MRVVSLVGSKFWSHLQGSDVTPYRPCYGMVWWYHTIYHLLASKNITTKPNMPSSQEMCETSKLIARILDGASERAILVANDGTVVHMNGAAQHFLYHDKSAADPHVLEFLRPEEDEDGSKDWQSAQRARIVMKNGKTTRTPRELHWVHAGPCPCGCQVEYHTAYICSKHEKVRELVDHAFDPVITADTRGIIMTANEAATQLFGYTEGELVGSSLSILCGGGHAELHDSYLEKYRATGEQKIIGKRREVMARRKNGTEFPCELGVTQVEDVSTGQRFFTGFFKDLTLLKQHEAEIQERQDLLQGMINASLDSMLEIDQHGIIRVVNDSACNMFGYTRQEFLGSNVSMICGGGHAEHHAKYMERYMATGESHIIGRKRQVQARRKDGSEFTVELSVQEVILSSTGKKAFCGFLRDMTLQQHAKRTLRKQRQMIHGKFFGSSGAEDGESGGSPPKKAVSSST